MRGIFFEHLVVIFGHRGYFHDVEHHFWRSLSIDAVSLACRSFGYDTHSLQLRLELEPPIYSTCVSSVTFEAKDDLRVFWRLVEPELPKIECFDFHRVSYQFVCSFYLNNGMIGCHVVENR